MDGVLLEVRNWKEGIVLVVLLLQQVADELAKLGSNRAMVPTGVFLQELHERSISKTLAKASKVAESSQ
jgi:hypothetical protein